MKITEKAWTEYIDRLARLNETAGQKMAEYIEKHGTADTETLISYAYALVQKYGEGSAELACQMYDSMAARSAADVPPAEPAAPASRREVEGMVKANRESPPQLQSGVSRFVKLAASDTTLKNASRDGAEFAWVPHGDTCAFCIMLASNGWKKAGRKTKRGTHAQHIHAHCNCEYAVRFDDSTSVAGYDPDRYLAQYADADGDLNAIRREHYAKHKDIINAQKRAAYAKRRAVQDGTSGGPALFENTCLPRWNTAVIPKEKFSEYALNPEKAPDKAVAFFKALGYNIDSTDSLIENIRTNLKRFPAIDKGDKGYGKQYEVRMDLTGPNGKTAKVITAWIDDKQTGEMRLVSAYVDKKKGGLK